VVLATATNPAAASPADEPTTNAPTHSVTPATAGPTPSIPFVDLAPLDSPDLGVTVYWLGLRFEPGGELPPLVLRGVAGPAPPGGGPADSRGHLDYGAVDASSAGVMLQLMHATGWDRWVAQDPAGDAFATVYHMFWDSPCAEREELVLDGGRAVIYASYQALADSAVTECPSGPFDRYLAHVFVGDTVVLVNAPFYLEEPSGSGATAPYNSLEGMHAVVRGLHAREPVAEPTPLPTPAAGVDDPGSLVLQDVDLPGRYGYGDDGCDPDRNCAVGPQRFSSEGGYAALPRAGGEFLSFYFQYEHSGVSAVGTPDPAVEPPRIDSFALVCLQACDPAAILEAGPELLRYHGHATATEIDGAPVLGDEARLYTVDTFVFGQDAPGYAVIWQHGPVVAMLVIGGVDGEQGQALAIELASKQEVRIQAALGS
jgi:hypothetical protein